MVTKKTFFFRGSTLESIQSAKASMANFMPLSSSISWQTPFISVLHLQKTMGCETMSYEYIIPPETWSLWFNMETKTKLVHTNSSLTGPCLHHRYELKTSISAFFHSDECLRSESGRIIRSSNLWSTGSSELDSTSKGAQRNSTVALYSYTRKTTCI